MSGLIGTLLDGRYRIDQRVGSGGMSTVYKAFDLTLERDVAIKIMHREIASDSDQIERFRREARAVAQLHSPHIVTVIDVGEDRGHPYIVFEYVSGETLKQRIVRSGKLSIPESIAYAIEIGRALVVAHAHHLVHRDIKPQNVLIDSEGSAKITDFGIARTLDEEGLTADGRVIGTTEYVSPEQALGRDVTGQSDIYSLGVVLFEMLTGQVPFQGESPIASAMSHVREPLPDIQTLRPEVSSVLAAVIDRATTKNLTGRYNTVEGFLEDLEDALAVETSRTDNVSGQTTAVLRTLPESTRRRVPARLLHPLRIGLLTAVVVTAGVVLAAALTSNTKRGTGPAPVPGSPGLKQVRLGQNAANDYDPLGGDGEHPEEAVLAVDRVSRTSWNTENYSDRTLGKAGVGIYVDAKPRVRAKALSFRTSTPGFNVQIYGAKSGPPDRLPSPGWVRLGSANQVKSKQRINFSSSKEPYRFYLLWITSLPPNKTKVSISEIGLFR